MILIFDLIKKLLEAHGDIVLIFLGLIITSIISYLTQAKLLRKKEKIESKNLAYSLLAEIKAINDISRKREYLDLFKKEMDKDKPEIYHIKVNQNYIGIYENNLSVIGKLDFKISQKIITYYTQVKSLLEDIELLNNFDSHEDINYKELRSL